MNSFSASLQYFLTKTEGHFSVSVVVVEIHQGVPVSVTVFLKWSWCTVSYFQNLLTYNRPA